MIIRVAEQRDLDGIVSLAEEWELKDPNAGESEDTVQGFLVSGYSKEDYKAFLESGAVLLVAAANGSGELAGFLLAGDPTLFRWSAYLQASLSREDFESVLVIKQICAKRMQVRRSLGSSFYRYLSDTFPGRVLAAAIVLEPPNTASIRFHEKLGFVKMLEFSEDGIKKGLWIRR